MWKSGFDYTDIVKCEGENNADTIKKFTTKVPIQKKIVHDRLGTGIWGYALFQLVILNP